MTCTPVLQSGDLKKTRHILEGARSTPTEVRLPSTSAPVADPDATSAIPRRTKLNPGDCLRHGYTVGCPGYEQLQLNSAIRRNYTEECRRRIEGELSKTPDGQSRLNRAKDRLDIRVAEIRRAEIDRENNDGYPRTAARQHR